MDCSSPSSSVHEDFSGKNTVVGYHAVPPGDLPNPGFKLWSPILQGDSLLFEPPRKPKNTGVGGLSLLQRDLPDPGIKPRSPALQVGSLPAEVPV